MDVGSVDNFIAEQENKATLQKTQRDVKLLQTFLGTRNELRKVEEISALELNEYICERWERTVAQKDHTCKLKMLLQIKNFTCKLKMLLQIKNTTYKLKTVHAN